MSDPTRSTEDARARAALHQQADAVNRLDPVWSPEYGDDAYLTSQPEEPVVPRERLFSRKVLFSWAIAALIFVFAIRVVMPVVFESVKEAVISSLKEPNANTSVSPVVAPALPAPETKSRR